MIALSWPAESWWDLDFFLFFIFSGGLTVWIWNMPAWCIATSCFKLLLSIQNTSLLFITQKVYRWLCEDGWLIICWELCVDLCSCGFSHHCSKLLLIFEGINWWGQICRIILLLFSNDNNQFAIMIWSVPRIRLP